MKDSEFIRTLKKYKRPAKECWQSEHGGKAIVFILTPKQWTEFRRKFNSPIKDNK